MNRPNFLFIGPDKSGSSWLFDMLVQHPRCFIPPAKDLYFFDRYYERGLPWYLKHYSAAPSRATVIGEVCHDYLYSDDAAGRILQDLPDARLMVILREPVERSFSHYLYLIRSGRTKLPLRDAVVAHPEIVSNSRYGEHLARYFDIFPHSQIGIFYFDDLQANPVSFAKKVLDFVGLDWIDDIRCTQKVRPASAPRAYLLAKAIKWSASRARDLGLSNLIGRIKNGRVASLLYKPYDAEHRPILSEADRMWLASHFDGDLNSLKTLLRGDMPRWLGSPNLADAESLRSPPVRPEVSEILS